MRVFTHNKMERGLPARQEFLRLNVSTLLLPLLVGTALAYAYLNYVVPSFAVIPVKYPTPDFQNKNATYYDVLGVSVNANGTEISEAYENRLTQLGNFGNPEPVCVSGSCVLELTNQYKVVEARQAYGILSGWERCSYEFEVLELGVLRYLHCLYNNYYHN